MDWDDVLKELEEWLLNGTVGFENAHTNLVQELHNCSNLEKEAILLKKLRVMGLLRSVICWHNNITCFGVLQERPPQLRPKDPQSPSEEQ
jgi:hypothetical protein